MRLGIGRVLLMVSALGVLHGEANMTTVQPCLRLIIHDTMPHAATVSWSFQHAQAESEEKDEIKTKNNICIPTADAIVLPILSATINGWHNRTLDVVLHPNQKEGLIHLPTPRTHGWVGRDGWNLGCIFGEIDLFLCSRNYEEREITSTHSDASRGTGECTRGCCVLGASHEFRVLAVSIPAGTRPFEVFLNLPLSRNYQEGELRGKILSNFRDYLSRLASNEAARLEALVLRWMRRIVQGYIQEYVELDSNLVELFYGTDSALFEDMQHLCKCAIPSLTAVAELQNALAREEEASSETIYTYAHKLGSLMMAASAFATPLCVETGTYEAETAIHLAAVCSTVYTIELSPELGARAQQKIEWARRQYNNRNITLFIGNSGDVLWREMIQKDARAALFFLDGHYSGGASTQLDSSVHKYFGSPLLDELEAVFARQNEADVIFIDDANHFWNTDKIEKEGYPTVTQIEEVMCEKAPQYNLQIKDGGIRIFKSTAPPQLSNACCHFGGSRKNLLHTLSGEVCPWECDVDYPNSALQPEIEPVPLHFVR